MLLELARKSSELNETESPISVIVGLATEFHSGR